MASRFTVTAAGGIVDCRIVESSGLAAFQARICTKMFDGPFVPASDATGAARSAELMVTVATSVEGP